HLEGVTTDLRETAVLPPSLRAVLSFDDPFLQSMLCAPSDVGCASETAGWTARAEAALPGRFHRRYWLSDPPEADMWTTCEKQANAGEVPDDAYTVWHDCLEASRKPERALPLGSIRSPKDGWLVVQG